MSYKLMASTKANTINYN